MMFRLEHIENYKRLKKIQAAVKSGHYECPFELSNHLLMDTLLSIVRLTSFLMRH
jgi:hypothetical protein